MRTQRWMVALATVALVAVLAAACQRSGANDEAGLTDQPRPHAGGTLSFGIDTDLNGLDPTRNAWDPVSMQVANALYDTMFAFDSEGTPQPYVLESADHDPEYLHWTLTLRPGVRFHNGRIATGEDLARDIRAYRDSFVTGQGTEDIADAVTIDDRTARVDLKRPWAAFPANLTAQIGTVLAIEQIDDPYGHSHPIGTGPFKLQQWNQNEGVKLVRNADYWRTDAAGVRLPYLDGVAFRIVPDQDKELEMLRAGDLDVYQTRIGTMSSAPDELAAKGEILVEHDPGATETSFVMFNTAKPPFDDVRIRRALAYATDLDALATTFNWPRDRLTDTPVSPSSPYHAEVDFPRNDRAKARQLIEEYEQEKGAVPKIALSVPFDTDVAQALTEQWRAVGIETTRDVIDFKHAVLYAVAGQYEAMLFAYYAATDVDMLYSFWISDTVRPLGDVGLNLTRLADSEIDEALDAGEVSADPAVRKEAYERLQRRLAEVVSHIWLARLDWVVARRPNVHDPHNVTLPGGRAAAPFESGVFRLTETWLS